MKDEVFVSQMETTDADIAIFMKQNGLGNVRMDYHVVDDLSTIALVAAGLGICIMPELVMNDIPYAVDRYPMMPGSISCHWHISIKPELPCPGG